MNRVGAFKKVSFDQFWIGMSGYCGDHEINSTKSGIIAAMEQIYHGLKLPKRATSGSAGYDFYAPFSFELRAGETIVIPTGIRAKIDEGWWLGCLPRSGLGFKYRLQLNNTMGVIDSDYYNSDNEGHIFAQITNDSKDGKTLEIKAGDGFLQAIFIPFGITYLDEATAVRNGGMGSTSKADICMG